MGRCTVTQPDGRFAIWSSTVDNFILYNATKEELLAFYLKEAQEQFEHDFSLYLDKFCDFNDCIEDTKSQHGISALPKDLKVS